jgi:hypothetical protein
MQSLKVRGTTIRLACLEEDVVEYLLADMSPDFIKEIVTAVNQTSYVIKEETKAIGNRVAFKLNTSNLPFQDLRQRVAQVIVVHMEHDAKRTVKKKKTSRQHKSGSRSYSQRPQTA